MHDDFETRWGYLLEMLMVGSPLVLQAPPLSNNRESVIPKAAQIFIKEEMLGIIYFLYQEEMVDWAVRRVLPTDVLSSLAPACIS